MSAVAEKRLKGGGAQGLPSELRQLWFAALRRNWGSLAVVPAHPGGSALRVAEALVEVGELHGTAPVRLLDARGLSLSGASQAVLEMTTRVFQGGRVIVLMDSVVENESGIPLLMAADAALLCVELGQTKLASARRTLELAPQDRFIGSVVLHPGAAA